MKIPVCMSALVAAVATSAEFVAEPLVPAPWKELTSLAIADKTHTVSVQLPMSNTDVLESFVEAVSDPTSASYGKYLTAAEVNTLTAPESTHVAAVDAWLSRVQEENCGMEYESILEGATFKVTAPKTCLGRLFNTEFRTLLNTQTRQTIVRAAGYTIPDSVAEHISFVSGMHGLPLPPKNKFKKRLGDNIEVTPEFLKSQYKIGGVEPSGTTKNRQAVFETQGQIYSKADLEEYFKTQVKDYKEGDDQVYKVVGKQPSGAGQGEASLDIQVIMGIAPGIKTEFWYYPGNGFCDAMLDFTNQILDTEDAPNVFSVSYGWQGHLSRVCYGYQSTVPHINKNFAKIAARGITMLVSSGDDGSADNFYNGGDLFASWPASSPYVTAVGGTWLADGEEVATTQFGSGGGFSYDFDISDAKWQYDDVKKYLSEVSEKPPTTSFAQGGRGTPDLSALGENYVVYISGSKYLIGGTSASAPLVAGLVSLLNEERISNGKPALGLINALVYQNPDAFTDVTVGDNKLSRQGSVYNYGWECAKGWDAVTGVGTPLFDKLRKIVMQ